eukprot:11032091-Alexandrium_andersonii.AAC.1
MLPNLGLSVGALGVGALVLRGGVASAEEDIALHGDLQAEGVVRGGVVVDVVVAEQGVRWLGLPALQDG